MRTTTIDTPMGPVFLYYPDAVAFMYSRQPVIVRFQETDEPESATVTVTNTETKRSHTEQRALYNNRADFDISRIMQMLAPDVDDITSRVDYETAKTLAQEFKLEVKTTSMAEGFEASITGMYGALDQGETYGMDTAMRLWVNFPQTINVWEDTRQGTGFVFSDASRVIPATSGAGPCWECDFKAIASQAPDKYEAMLSAPSYKLYVTRRYTMEDGSLATPLTRTRAITLTADHSKPKDGEYLRWLNRRGEMSYWLFTRSTLRIAASSEGAFRRYYEGNPSAPDGDIYKNRDKADFSEAREMALGTTATTLEEFEYISDLGTSPVVERMLTLSSGIRWQRVNVTAGTYERQVKRDTPSRQDLEIIIQLPERNTVKL